MRPISRRGRPLVKLLFALFARFRSGRRWSELDCGMLAAWLQTLLPASGKSRTFDLMAVWSLKIEGCHI